MLWKSLEKRKEENEKRNQEHLSRIEDLMHKRTKTSTTIADIAKENPTSNVPKDSSADPSTIVSSRGEAGKDQLLQITALSREGVELKQTQSQPPVSKSRENPEHSSEEEEAKKTQNNAPLEVKQKCTTEPNAEGNKEEEKVPPRVPE